MHAPTGWGTANMTDHPTTEPTTTAASTTVDERKPARFRIRRRNRKGANGFEGNAAVERNSTVVFQASPTTIAASLAKTTGDAAEAVIAWGAGHGGRAQQEEQQEEQQQEEQQQLPLRSLSGQTEAAASAAAAVFVIGAGPAERELLRRALGSHPYLHAAPEDGLLADMARLVGDNVERLAHHGYPEQHWYKSAGDEFAALQADRAAAAGKGRWVCVLDAAQLTLGTLDRMFPRARVVHVVGEGWSRRTVRGLRGQATRLSGGRYLEVRARDLSSSPGAVRAAVLEFLGEAHEPISACAAA
ncbi:MAG: hypothetical protein ACRDY7_02455 [Acidimicrobiia bacterium]